MRSAKKIYSYIIEAYNALYAASVPPVSFDELNANCTTYVDEYERKEYTFEKPLTDNEREAKKLKKKINFYAHWIPDYKFREIVDKIERKHRLKDIDVYSYRFHAYLGCGPSSSVDRWLEAHPEYTYDDFVKMATEAGYENLPQPKQNN